MAHLELTGDNAHKVLSLLASAEDLMTRLADGWDGDEPEEIAEVRTWLTAAHTSGIVADRRKVARATELAEHGVEHLDLKGEAG